MSEKESLLLLMELSSSVSEMLALIEEKEPEFCTRRCFIQAKVNQQRLQKILDDRKRDGSPERKKKGRSSHFKKVEKLSKE